MTFESFLDKNFEPLSRYSAVLTGDRYEAHDVLADSLAYATWHWSKIGTTENPYGYVRRVVTTTYLQHLRRDRRRARTTLLDTADLQTGSRCPGSAIEDRDQLEKAIQQLSRHAKSGDRHDVLPGYDAPRDRTRTQSIRVGSPGPFEQGTRTSAKQLASGKRRHSHDTDRRVAS